LRQQTASSPARPLPRSLRVRIRAEDLDEVAVLAQKLDGLDNLAVLHVAIAINEEKVFHAFRLLGRDSIFVMLICDGGTRQSPGATHRPCRPRSTSDLCGRCPWAGCIGGPTRGSAWRCRVVLNVLFQHAQAIFLGGQDAVMAALTFPFAANSAERAFDDVSKISTFGRCSCTHCRHCPSACGCTYNRWMSCNRPLPAGNIEPAIRFAKRFSNRCPRTCRACA